MGKLFTEALGNLFTEEVGKLLTRLLGNYLTVALGKVLDIYMHTSFTKRRRKYGSGKQWYPVVF